MAEREPANSRHQLNYVSQFINHYVLWILILIFISPPDPSHFKKLGFIHGEEKGTLKMCFRAGAHPRLPSAAAGGQPADLE